MPMNPEIKAKWIAALRSGEYKQGKLCLHPTPDTFCCLGVLCEVIKKEYGKDYAADNYYVPYHIQAFVGLDVENPSVYVDVNTHSTETEKTCTLGMLNDDYNFNFIEIADLVEKEL